MDKTLEAWNERCRATPAYFNNAAAMRQFFRERGEEPPEVALVSAEYTDTFGGEPNYCWVRRAKAILPVGMTQTGVSRYMKRLLGLSGVRFRVGWDTGDSIRYDETNACCCLFINWSF